jgi:hypothetical protein
MRASGLVRLSLGLLLPSAMGKTSVNKTKSTQSLRPVYWSNDTDTLLAEMAETYGESVSLANVQLRRRQCPIHWMARNKLRYNEVTRALLLRASPLPVASGTRVEVLHHRPVVNRLGSLTVLMLLALRLDEPISERALISESV